MNVNVNNTRRVCADEGSRHCFTDTVQINRAVHAANVEIRLNGALTVSGASGNVGVALTRIDDAGLRVNSVSGNVYLRLPNDLNAEFSISNTSGAVSGKIEGLTIDKVSVTNYSGHIGSGGPRIVVSNVSGAVVLQRI